MCIILVIFFLPYIIVKPLDSKDYSIRKAFPFLLLFTAILFIGLRDPYGDWRFFGDTSAYTRTFESIQNGQRTEFTKDLGFYIYMKFISQFFDVEAFYLISAITYVYLPYLMFQKWFKEKAIYVLIVFLVSMSFWAFGINGVRNGLASSIFLFSLRYFDKKWVMYLLMILSITFHKAMILPFLAFIASDFILVNNKKTLYFWMICLPISLLFRGTLENIAELIFSSDTLIQDERATIYFSEEGQKYDVSGQFRWDFILYSSIAVFIGYWSITKKALEDNLYQMLFRTYTISNAIWILLIYAPFTNRIAYLSWFLMPIVLTVPFIIGRSSDAKLNKKKLIYILYGSLFFTIFMNFK
jgi:hypothetical protein